MVFGQPVPPAASGTVLHELRPWCRSRTPRRGGTALPRHGDEIILSLYARGLTTRNIQARLDEVYGVSVSPALISNITDVVQDEIVMWQTRPLDAFYAIIYVDALAVKVRDGGMVQNKAAYLAVSVDADGFKHMLGIWLGGGEGSALRKLEQEIVFSTVSHRARRESRGGHALRERPVPAEEGVGPDRLGSLRVPGGLHRARPASA
jgi:hypothetical protein